MTPLLEVRGLTKRFAAGGTLARGAVRTVVDAVDFQVGRAEIVALVGESGSGKSTIARLIARLDTPEAGALCLDGEDVLVREPRGASRAYRRRVQMIFQDPFGSLNPVHTLAHHLERPLELHGRASGAELRPAVHALLAQVGLSPPEEYAALYPHALSGGQRQRVAIARALAPQPELLIADEPTSMLDVSIRMGVLALLRQLRDTRGISLLLITHDLASARFLADRILVLSGGRIVEAGPTAQIVDAPQHPYTRQLLAAAPGATRTAPPATSHGD
jgi:ABC-type glutathione transport system ATPase component